MTPTILAGLRLSVEAVFFQGLFAMSSSIFASSKVSAAEEKQPPWPCRLPQGRFAGSRPSREVGGGNAKVSMAARASTSINKATREAQTARLGRKAGGKDGKSHATRPTSGQLCEECCELPCRRIRRAFLPFNVGWMHGWDGEGTHLRTTVTMKIR